MSDKTSLSDLARQAGFVPFRGPGGDPLTIASDKDIEKFAALHRVSIIAELCADAGEPVAQRHQESGDLDFDPPTEYEQSLGWLPLYPASTVAALQARVAELEAKLG